MQVVLYHASGEIAVQYRDVDPDARAGATFGIQDGDARSALAFACGSSATPLPAATCYFDEPPTASIMLRAEPAGAGTTVELR